MPIPIAFVEYQYGADVSNNTGVPIEVHPNAGDYMFDVLNPLATPSSPNAPDYLYSPYGRAWYRFDVSGSQTYYWTGAGSADDMWLIPAGLPVLFGPTTDDPLTVCRTRWNLYDDGGITTRDFEAESTDTFHICCVVFTASQDDVDPGFTYSFSGGGTWIGPFEQFTLTGGRFSYSAWATSYSNGPMDAITLTEESSGATPGLGFTGGFTVARLDVCTTASPVELYGWGILTG